MKPADSGIDDVTVDDAIVAGLYRVSSAPGGQITQLRLLASGPSVRVAQQASVTLADRGNAAEVWSVTSWKQLRDDALDVERWNRAHPDDAPRVSHLHRALGGGGVPMVALSDYVTALPDTLARFVTAPYVSLGTDGYGLSDTRDDLRAHFGTDAAGVTSAALELLGKQTAPTPALTAIPGQEGPRDTHLVA
jgi:pyruvate dehydrogenase E1 component